MYGVYPRPSANFLILAIGQPIPVQRRVYQNIRTHSPCRQHSASNAAIDRRGEVIGEEKGLVAISFVLQVLSVEVCQSRLFMPDAMAGGTLGGSISLGLRMFDGDEPAMYYFPAKDEPDLILTDLDDKTTQTLVEMTEPLKT
jgi:hypothetical protein